MVAVGIDVRYHETGDTVVFEVGTTSVPQIRDSGLTCMDSATMAKEDDANAFREFLQYKSFQSEIQKTIRELVTVEQAVYTNSAPQEIKFIEEKSANAITMRRDIGADDSLYMRVGLSFVWAGGDKTALFPSTLPSIRRQMEATMYDTAIETVKSTLDQQLHNLSEWETKIENIINKTNNKNSINPLTFWNDIPQEAIQNLFGQPNDKTESYKNFYKTVDGLKLKHNTSGWLRVVTDLILEIAKFDSQNDDPKLIEDKNILNVKPSYFTEIATGATEMNIPGLHWQITDKTNGDVAPSKESVPLLYALATCNELVQMDILDYIDIGIVESGKNVTMLLSVDANGNWTQKIDPNQSEDPRSIWWTKTLNATGPTFKRVTLMNALDKIRTNIKEYITLLEGRKNALPQSSKRQRTDNGDDTDNTDGKVDPIDKAQREQRNAIWSDAHREMIVSGDRLYAFIRVMAGTLNEEVSAAIHVEDRSLDAAQNEYRKQRSELIRQQRIFSQRVINEFLTSVFRSSNIKIDLSLKKPETSFEEQLIVVNEESIEEVRKLSETTSNGFLSTNVDMLRAFENLKGNPTSLSDFVNKVQTILHTQNLQAQAQLARTQYQRDQSSLEYLSEPRNSFVIRLKNEAFAAIRRAFHEFKNEWAARRIPMTPPRAWELVEGGTDDLTDAFAQYAAYLWSNSRLFSSSTAAFIGVTPAKINLIVLRTALEKLVRRAINYKRTPNAKPIPVPTIVPSIFDGLQLPPPLPARVPPSAPPLPLNK